jgi:hypothetical protein
MVDTNPYEMVLIFDRVSMADGCWCPSISLPSAISVTKFSLAQAGKGLWGGGGWWGRGGCRRPAGSHLDVLARGDQVPVLCPVTAGVTGPPSMYQCILLCAVDYVTDYCVGVYNIGNWTLHIILFT